MTNSKQISPDTAKEIFRMIERIGNLDIAIQTTLSALNERRIQILMVLEAVCQQAGIASMKNLKVDTDTNTVTWEN